MKIIFVLSLLMFNIAMAQPKNGGDPVRSELIKVALDQCYDSTGVIKPDLHSKSIPLNEDLIKLNQCLTEKGFGNPNP